VKLEPAPVATPLVHWKLAERFQVVAVGSGDYRFVSITQNIRIRNGDPGNSILDQILPLLERGCFWNELVELVGHDREAEVKSIVSDLAGRGLLEQLAPEETVGRIPEEFEYYRSQRKFFSNFLVYGNEPPDTADVKYGSEPQVTPQQRLKDSTVLIAGLGQTGLAVAKMLARAGLGRIFGADASPVGHEDIRHSGYPAASLGCAREEAAAVTVQDANHHIAYSAWRGDSPWSPNPGNWPENPDLLIVCEDQFDAEHYRNVNRLCLDRNIRWISHRCMELRCEVGPWIVPGETACYRCLEMRKAANVRNFADSLAARQLLLARNEPVARLNFTLGTEVLALEVTKILGGFSRPMTYGSLLTFSLVSLESKLHPVLKVPRCAACSAGKREQPSLNIWRAGGDFEDL
jgi:bacteriocin biosynthesis cyclodehydratase domain-containing protein